VFLSNGYFDLTFGSEELRQHTDVVVDNNGQLFVADSLNHCACVFRLDGFFVRKIGTQGKDELTNICGLAVGLYGFLLVADSLKHCIMVFDKDGNHVHCFEAHGSGKRQFKTP